MSDVAVYYLLGVLFGCLILLVYCLVGVFLHAGDGILVAQESRGLGDVYEGQWLCCVCCVVCVVGVCVCVCVWWCVWVCVCCVLCAVSYTQLMLQT